ncbi:hypothetical protein NXV73_21215 [Bacteroides salyersiae]|nr:hypothetical protein [Bacteroides salyersiae]
MYATYKDEFNRMQDCITDGLLYCMQKSDGKLRYQVDELSRQNEILCADIAYIHKTGVGYGLENAKRQKAYEEAKSGDGRTGQRGLHTFVPLPLRIIEKQVKTNNILRYGFIVYSADNRTSGH